MFTNHDRGWKCPVAVGWSYGKRVCVSIVRSTVPLLTTMIEIRILALLLICLFVAASHQTRLDTWSKARRPIKVGIKGRGRSGTSRDSNLAGLCSSSVHLVKCEPDKASSFTNPNMGPGTYAGL